MGFTSQISLKVNSRITPRFPGVFELSGVFWSHFDSIWDSFTSFWRVFCWFFIEHFQIWHPKTLFSSKKCPLRLGHRVVGEWSQSHPRNIWGDSGLPEHFCARNSRSNLEITFYPEREILWNTLGIEFLQLVADRLLYSVYFTFQKTNGTNI